MYGDRIIFSLGLDDCEPLTEQQSSGTTMYGRSS